MGRLLFYHLPRAGFVGAGALDRSIFFQLGKHALHLSLGEPELFAKRPRGMGRIVFEQRDDLIFQRIYSDICSDIYTDTCPNIYSYVLWSILAIYYIS